MKTILLSIIALCSTVAAWAQNVLVTAVLHHESQTTLFTGSHALVRAYDAAVDGDVITLSSGYFEAPVIAKAVSIYGSGCEGDATTQRYATYITTDFTIKTSDSSTLSDIHLEGLQFHGKFNCYAPLENFVVEKCRMNQEVGFYANNKNTTISNCVVLSFIHAYSGETTNCHIKNTYISRYVRLISAEGSVNSVNIDHCVIADYGTGTHNITNSIFTYKDYNRNHNSPFTNPSSTKVSNCVFVSESPISSFPTFTNCFIVDDPDKIFSDFGSGGYTEERSFEIQQPALWIGTDGQEVGIRYGWSKLASSIEPTGVDISLSGNNLTIQYQQQKN